MREGALPNRQLRNLGTAPAPDGSRALPNRQLRKYLAAIPVPLGGALPNRQLRNEDRSFARRKLMRTAE